MSKTKIRTTRIARLPSRKNNQGFALLAMLAGVTISQITAVGMIILTVVYLTTGATTKFTKDIKSGKETTTNTTVDLTPVVNGIKKPIRHRVQKLPKDESYEPCSYATPPETTSKFGDVNLYKYNHKVGKLIIKEYGSSYEHPLPADIDKWSEDAGMKLELVSSNVMGGHVVMLPYAIDLFDAASLINFMFSVDSKRPNSTIAKKAGTHAGCRYKYIEADLTNDNLLEAPKDPFFKDQWNIKSETTGSAKFDGAWSEMSQWKGNKNSLAKVTIAVMDSGFWHENNPALSGVNDSEYTSDVSYVDITQKYMDSFGRPWCLDSEMSGCHGEIVASVLGAKSNDKGIVGALGIGLNYGEAFNVLPIAPPSRVHEWHDDEIIAMLLKLSGLDKSNKYKNLPSVINMSFGNDEKCSIPMAEAIAKIHQKNEHVVIVAAAGNNFHPLLDATSPASCKGVIPVVAHDADGKVMTGGARGVKNITLSAPGVNIPVMATMEKEMLVRGTSAAAPHVSALAAMLLSVNPSLKWNEVFDIMYKTANKISLDEIPKLREMPAINAKRAVEMVIESCAKKGACCTIC